MTTMYYEKDAKPELLKAKKIAILGYGSQGHAHALNLHDSGYDVRVGLRPESSSVHKAEEAGLRVLSIADACAEADVIMMLVPDTEQKRTYDAGHRAAPHGGQVPALRARLQHPLQPDQPAGRRRRRHGRAQGSRVTWCDAPTSRAAACPSLIAVHQDATGHAHDLALAYADGIGATRAGVLETTFTEETETDLFGEQVVLCGGVTALVRAGYETLVEAGYQPESAYFECLHELKLIVDLMYEEGITGMRFQRLGHRRVRRPDPRFARHHRPGQGRDEEDPRPRSKTAPSPRSGSRRTRSGAPATASCATPARSTPSRRSVRSCAR